jgi:hypothetical protein
MTRTATRLFITAALALGGATAVGAQSMGAPAAPLPGTGNSAKISTGNQENNSAYNQLIGAGDQKGKPEQRALVRHAAVAATAADIKAGLLVRDIKGVPIGTVVSSDATQVIVDTGQTKIGVPLVGFGKDDKGLLVSITADKFKELVAQAHARAQGSN